MLVLETESKTLQIFANSDKEFANVLAVLDVAAGAEIAATAERTHSFLVKTSDAAWHLAMNSAADKDAWIETVAEYAGGTRNAKDAFGRKWVVNGNAKYITCRSW
jgi:hypothetical protein